MVFGGIGREVSSLFFLPVANSVAVYCRRPYSKKKD